MNWTVHLTLEVKRSCYSNEGAELLFHLLSRAPLVSAESAYVLQHPKCLDDHVSWGKRHVKEVAELSESGKSLVSLTYLNEASMYARTNMCHSGITGLYAGERKVEHSHLVWSLSSNYPNTPIFKSYHKLRGRGKNSSLSCLSWRHNVRCYGALIRYIFSNSHPTGG